MASSQRTITLLGFEMGRKMIEIDGSQESGSGTIVRDAVSFSVLPGKDLHIKNIRAKRDKPGLRTQHLKAIEASAQICRGRLEGAEVGSSEIIFRPGKKIGDGASEKELGLVKKHS
jgi:RNA 3'-terminal phosphate cyclase (ATP)